MITVVKGFITEAAEPKKLMSYSLNLELRALRELTENKIENRQRI